MKLIKGNCLEEMKKLPDKSVDLFICDLPYTDMKGKGETNCSWNQGVLDLEEFWVQFKRLRKSKRTACIHFCSTRFGFSLINSWQKGYRMDMVWRKRNKTGGLSSRYRPMRNHEMVYFFYENAPKYNRDKYHKRINNKKHAKSETTKEKKSDTVIEEKYTKEYLGNKQKTVGTGSSEMQGIFTKEAIKKFQKENGANFDPPNPASVIEEAKETDPWGLKNGGDKGRGVKYEPPNPASVIEEDEEKYTKEHLDNNRAGAGRKSVKDRKSMCEPTGLYPKENQTASSFEPPNPASVLEEKDEFIEPSDDEPVTMFESTKVFIGKRNHQTEKPQDILEFFLKYWSDEGDVILDPTMGSGSTGVACKKLGREFIGIELTEKYYEVAKQRIEN
jgi:DNA modification methylase